MEEETKRPGKSRRKKEEEPFDLKKEIISWIQIIAAAVVIAFFLTTFIIANSRIPTEFSRVLITLLTLDWVEYRILAASLTEPVSAQAIKYSSCLISILFIHSI